MTDTTVVILKTEPWIHAKTSTRPNHTLCGITRKPMSEWLDSEISFLNVFEAEPHHRVFHHICGICWWKYSHTEQGESS